MIAGLRIEGYRCFEHFEMSGLGRVNLLVGTNNCGKTSVLEAIHLLSTAGDSLSLWQTLSRRGERLPTMQAVAGERIRRSPVELDVSHLFHGHEIQSGSMFRISTWNQLGRNVDYSIAELSRDQAEFFPDEEIGPPSRLALRITGHPKPPVEMINLTRSGGLVGDALDMSIRRARQSVADALPACFINTESLSGDALVSMWNTIALTPNEGLALEALRILDGRIERIAAQAPSGPYYDNRSRGGFIIKLRGLEQPVPIGSMGDGMWRMLAMAISITQCRGGVLLVDEIDTGLHYSVMSKMWTLIYHAAMELNVQVFATTHSYDCVYSLAQICAETSAHGKVTVQRIEAGKRRSIPYGEEEIAVAAERDIEVR